MMHEELKKIQDSLRIFSTDYKSMKYLNNEQHNYIQELKKEKDAEIARWQDAIYKLLVKETEIDIDGGGCDSGDPLDFTLCEIQQALNFLKDKEGE